VLNFSPEKILLLMVIALVVLGPNRLPGVARSMGKAIGQLRQMSGSIQNEVSSALAEPKDALMGSVGDLGLNDLRQSIRGLNPLNPPATGPRSSSVASGTTTSGVPTAGALGGPVGAAPSPMARGDLPPAPDDPSLN
jgi:Tat protein translocase TatB subunit